jgi:UDPglucose 6-dehydrogenase
MRVAVIGTGYVGLVMGAGLSNQGHEVVCVDCDSSKVARLRQGGVSIYEPGLTELVVRNIERGTLHFTTSTAEAIRSVEMVFIAVGTPIDERGEANLSAVWQAVDSIAVALTGSLVVVVKSTVPVGTCMLIERRLAERARFACSVVSNPEFLKEGCAVDDFLRPDRVVIGANDERAQKMVAELYAPFTTAERCHLMDLNSAELTKYASNALLAVRISFMNEMAGLAERVGADIEEVRRGLGSDSRIGPHFLRAGVGFGGSCFPKDLSALLSTGAKVDAPLEIIHATQRANVRQRLVLPRKIEQHFGSGLAGKTLALWGLAFKPDTDDIREAPSLVLIDRLLQRGARVVAHDPVAMDNAHRHFGDRVKMAPSMYHAVEGADGLALVTEWREFGQPDFRRLRSLMRAPVIFDGRNIWDPVKLRRIGFRYYGIGRR